jgi:hypothetical protein
MIDLYNYSLLIIFLAGLGLIIAAREAGRVVGVRVGKQGGNSLPTLEAEVNHRAICAAQRDTVKAGAYFERPLEASSRQSPESSAPR